MDEIVGMNAASVICIVLFFNVSISITVCVLQEQVHFLTHL